MFTNVKEVWSKLIEHCPGGHRLLPARPAEDRQADQRGQGRWPPHGPVHATTRPRRTGTPPSDILKTVIDYDDKNPGVRKEIIECYRASTPSTPSSTTTSGCPTWRQSYRNVHEAMADFEKHIAFDVGQLRLPPHLEHRPHQRASRATRSSIDFAKKRGHSHEPQDGDRQPRHARARTISGCSRPYGPRTSSTTRSRSDVRLGAAHGHQELRQPRGHQEDQGRAGALGTDARASGPAGAPRPGTSSRPTPMFGNAPGLGRHLHRPRPPAVLRGEDLQPVQGRERASSRASRYIRDFVDKGQTGLGATSPRCSGSSPVTFVRTPTANEHVIAVLPPASRSWLPAKHLAPRRPSSRSASPSSSPNMRGHRSPCTRTIKDSELKCILPPRTSRPSCPTGRRSTSRLFPYSLSRAHDRHPPRAAGHTDSLQSMVIDIVENYTRPPRGLHLGGRRTSGTSPGSRPSACPTRRS
ncbi:MAG: hypothetical protein MZU97_12500 [Bacillus subtilis]|nr:hypothetical protein [Bacillus subtilis]